MILKPRIETCWFCGLPVDVEKNEYGHRSYHPECGIKSQVEHEKMMKNYGDLKAKVMPRFKIEVQHLIKQTNLQKKAMKTYSC